MMSAETQPQQPDSGVPSGYGQTAYKRRLAYAHLGINPSDVRPVAFFRENLRRIARQINRGRARDQIIHPFDYLLSSADPDGRKVAKLYLSVPASHRRLLPPQAFCQAAGVSPYRVLEIITGAAVRFGAEASMVLAATMLEDVVQKLIDKALQPDGDKDRELYFRLAQYLPTRCGW
jgi:hypothetical protein